MRAGDGHARMPPHNSARTALLAVLFLSHLGNLVHSICITIMPGYLSHRPALGSVLNVEMA